VLERPLRDFDPGLTMDRWLNMWRRARNRKEGVHRSETLCVRADGSQFPADVTLSFLRFQTAEYLVVYLNDITERHQVQAALQESDARLQGIAANVPGLVFRLERSLLTGELDFPISAKAARAWRGFPRPHCACAKWACAAWCIRMTGRITIGCRTWRWTATVIGPGKVGS
jgi:hypothetical protein